MGISHPKTDISIYEADVRATLARLSDANIVRRIWQKDHTVWKPEPTEIKNRLGWLTITDLMSVQVPMLQSFAQDVRDAGFRHVVFPGMGIIQIGIRHKGFALIEVLQPCPSFNHQNTNTWYRERVYKLEGEQGYDPTDRMAAFAKALEWGERIPIGVLYRKPRPVYEEQLKALKQMPLVKQALNPLQFEELLNELL
jgi:hypothetical protein